MKVHPVDINLVWSKRGTPPKASNFHAVNYLSSDACFDYLNAIANYNITFNGKGISFYAIDENGNYKKYDSKNKAVRELKTNNNLLTECLNGTRKTTAGHTFVLAEKIEHTDKDGNIIIDQVKIEEITNSAFDKGKRTPIYAVDENGQYRKYADIKIAAKAFSAHPSHILSCLNGGAQKRIKNYAFVRAEDVERTDSNNHTILDTTKLRQIGQESSLRKSFVPIYAIGIDGSYKRYENKKRTARLFGIDNSTLTKYLQDKCNSDMGYAFIYASELEKKGQNNETALDYDLLKRKFEQINEKAVYAISKDGVCQKYISQADAARKLNLDSDRISRCINGRNSMVNGYVFVKASDIDSFENGILTRNSKLIKKFANELSKQRVKAIYSFDSEGNYRRHTSIKTVVDDLSVYTSSVRKCLSGEYRATHGYKFIYAENFEEMDEDGNLVVNYDKLDEISYEINPERKKTIDKLGKIYAIKSDKIEEFENLRVASRTLGIDETAIIYYLRNGTNPTDGTYAINKYVFASERYK
ncbi:hypothetical protein IJD44_01795 [bacterium]|nr:hypothetical protein [bacterium]